MGISTLMMCVPYMCQLESDAFEHWASSRGGLKRKQRAAEYDRRADMFSTWRESRLFKAWLPEHASKCHGTFIMVDGRIDVCTW